MEYKTQPQFIKSIDDRTVIGIPVVHGNIDDGYDRSHPALFGDGTVKGRRRAVFLWQHDSSAPPTAVINYHRDIPRDQLPKSVLDYAPEATGGVEVSRTYLDTPRGNEVLAGIKAGAIAEMSYAYDVTRFDYETLDDGRMIRNLYAAEVYDFSDVNWGMNPATVGSKGLPLHLEHSTVLAAVKSYIERLQSLRDLRAKEGRVLSGDNRKRIENAVEALDGATTALKDLLAATDPQKSQDAERLYLETLRMRSRLRQSGAIV